MKRKSSCRYLSETQCKDNAALCYWVEGTAGKQGAHCRSRPRREKRSRSQSKSAPRAAAAAAARSKSRSRSRDRSRSRSRSRSRARALSPPMAGTVHVPLYATVSTLLGPKDYVPTPTEAYRLADHVQELFQANTLHTDTLRWLFFRKMHKPSSRRRYPILEFDLQVVAAAPGAFATTAAAAHLLTLLANDEDADTLERPRITGFMRDAERRYGDAYALRDGVTVFFQYRLGV
jgi:hypothetical protein